MLRENIENALDMEQESKSSSSAPVSGRYYLRGVEEESDILLP